MRVYLDKTTHWVNIIWKAGVGEITMRWYECICKVAERKNFKKWDWHGQQIGDTNTRNSQEEGTHSSCRTAKANFSVVLLKFVSLTDRVSAPPTHLKLCSPCQMLRLKQVSGDEENSHITTAALRTLSSYRWLLHSELTQLCKHETDFFHM